MNLTRLFEIIGETTVQLRKGEAVVARGNVTEVFDMPHESEVEDVDKVDCYFVTIGVRKGQAEVHREELIQILSEYPHPDRLAGGPSYIEVGGEIGDQGAAFCLFALGKSLGLWDIITPTSLGMTGGMADQMAGMGMIMMSGYKVS